jgi:hypothetical protein
MHGETVKIEKLLVKVSVDTFSESGPNAASWSDGDGIQTFVRGGPSFISVLASCSGGTARELSRSSAKATKECIVRFALMFHKARRDSDISLCSCNEKPLVN